MYGPKFYILVLKKVYFVYNKNAINRKRKAKFWKDYLT